MNKTKRTFIALGLLVALAACAKSPDEIAAIQVAGDPYSQYSCQQLKQERLNVAQQLEVASAQQENAAAGDAMGVFLLGLPLSSMSGGDKEALIGVAKGRIQALDRRLVAKSCQ